jgi:hypothetical protein
LLLLAGILYTRLTTAAAFSLPPIGSFVRRVLVEDKRLTCKECSKPFDFTVRRAAALPGLPRAA